MINIKMSYKCNITKLILGHTNFLVSERGGVKIFVIFAICHCLCILFFIKFNKINVALEMFPFFCLKLLNI